MHIAILGATSRIAQDLIRSMAHDPELEFSLYARRPEDVGASQLGLFQDRHRVFSFDCFETINTKFDAIINFVGVGSPAQATEMGGAIFDATLLIDELGLAYVRNHPECRYLFLSSGAAYGTNFDQPVTDATKSIFDINHLGSQDWYGVAKLHAESRHRALKHLAIVDLRVFNYFSSSVKLNAGFLVTDILSSIINNHVMKTSGVNITRDYVGPREIVQLVQKILRAPSQNKVVDFFSRAPVDKFSMLEHMKAELGLQFEIVGGRTGLVATGNKLNYYSKSRRATQAFGYVPTATSLEIVLEQSRELLSGLESE